MAVVQTKLKSYSKILDAEFQEVYRGSCELLSELEKEALLELIANDDSLLSSLIEYEAIDYSRPVLSVEEWLSDPYYMGESAKDLFGPWKKDLIELFESKIYNVALILGSTGSGKSTFSQFAVLRMLYEASCLRDPAKSYGISSGSKISFCFLGSSANVARRVVFEGVIEKIKKSPYFMQEFSPLNNMKREHIKSHELYFPKNIVLIAGSSTNNSFIGENIMGGFVDELNFFQKMSQASRKHSTLDDRHGFDVRAGKIFDALQLRMKSRFLRMGRLPGVLIGASSKATKDSLTERLVRDAIRSKDKNIFVRDRSVIDVKRENYSPKSFKVFVGDDQRRPRIVDESAEHSYPEDLIIDIPEDLRKDFETNIEDSLRDLAGVSTNAMSVFISNTEKIFECLDDRKHPFRCHAMEDDSQWDSRSVYTIDWQQIAKREDNGTWHPIMNPSAPRVVHLDPALTGDAFGLCIGHVAGTTEVIRESKESSDPIREYLPVFVVDFVLRIQGSRDDEVLFHNVRKVLYDFSEHGFHFSKITMDTFQSREMCQALREQGYKAEILSVDESKEPYKYLRRTIYDGRLRMYKYNYLIDELVKLEDGNSKVDHPAGGAKDLSDSLCGVIWTLFEMGYSGNPIDVMKGSSERHDNPVTQDYIELPRGLGAGSDHIMVDGVLQPKKAAPKSLAPSYTKKKQDGSVVDARTDAVIMVEIG